MNKVFEISITERRKIGQMGLDSFMQGQHNMLDYPVDKLIASLKQKNDSILAELDRWSDIERNEPERFNAIEEKANRTGHSISIQMNDSILEIIYIEDELFALLEMKIIYAFKHLEIKIKQLLFAAYQDPYINRQFKWDTIIQFLRGKNINVKSLEAYDHINELRNVSNSLKHSDRVIDDTIKNIEEFQNREILYYAELELFYNRIRKAPNIFLDSLVSHVMNDIYTFSAQRLNDIANSFALRMEKEDAEQFVKILLNLY